VKNTRSLQTPTATPPEVVLDNFDRDRELKEEGKGADHKEDGEVVDHDVEAPKTRTRFSLKLRPGSDKGMYTVSLLGAFGQPLVTKRSRSADGKRLSVVMDLKGLAPKRRYHISVSRGVGPPDFYSIVVDPK
jgi:hypothetical protein